MAHAAEGIVAERRAVAAREAVLAVVAVGGGADRADVPTRVVGDADDEAATAGVRAAPGASAVGYPREPMASMNFLIPIVTR